MAIGGGAPFLAQPWQIDIERPNHSRHAPKRASSVLINKDDSCEYLINPWHIFVFSWRVGIRFLTFKQDLVRNREVRSGELGINLNNVSSYTQPRFSRDGGNIEYLYIACCWNIQICKSCSEYCVLLAEFWQTVDVIAGMQEKGNTSASSREIHQQIPGNTSSNSKVMGTVEI